MSKSKSLDKECERLEYALSLIDALAEQDEEPCNILENALRILDFGNLTPKQMLDYIEATR